MSTFISSDGASFGVQSLEDDPRRPNGCVLISAYALLGDAMQTKVGADLCLPPAKALLLADAIAKEAKYLIALREQTELREKARDAARAQAEAA